MVGKPKDETGLIYFFFFSPTGLPQQQGFWLLH